MTAEGRGVYAYREALRGCQSCWVRRTQRSLTKPLHHERVVLLGSPYDDGKRGIPETVYEQCYRRPV